MKNHILVTQLERRHLAAYFCALGIHVKTTVDSESLAAVVAAHTKKKLPEDIYGKMQMLAAFRNMVKEERARKLVSPRTPQRFRPLRLSKEMERAIERSKELRMGR